MTTSSATGALVAHWTYDTIVSGTTVPDIAGAMDDEGSLGGSPFIAPEGIAGKIGSGALRFTVDFGLGDIVSVAGTAVPTDDLNTATGDGQSRTFSVWFNTPALTASTQVIAAKDGEHFVAQLNSASGVRWRVTGSDLDGEVTSGPTGLTGAWHLMTGTFDGASRELTLYVDGSLVAGPTALVPAATVPSDDAETLVIGATDTNTFGYVGDLDDMAIWSNELTAIEALALFDLGDETALNYNASEVQSMFTAFAGMTDVTVDGTFWEYQASGIVGVEGEVNDLGGGDFSINLGGGAGFATGTAPSAANGSPEPSSAALLLLAIASMTALRRHTRRTA